MHNYIITINWNYCIFCVFRKNNYFCFILSYNKESHLLNLLLQLSFGFYFYKHDTSSFGTRFRFFDTIEWHVLFFLSHLIDEKVRKNICIIYAQRHYQCITHKFFSPLFENFFNVEVLFFSVLI